MDNTTWTTFCGKSPFWDLDLLINNTFPEFTECFRHTVVAYVPCGWLWLVTPVHVHYVMRHKSRVRIPPSVLNVSKIVLCFILLTLSVAEVILSGLEQTQDAAPPALYVDVVVTGLTYLLAALLTRISRKAMIVSPCVLFIFWLLSLVAHTIPLYHLIHTKAEARRPSFAVFCALYGAVSLQFLLNCCAEGVPEILSDKTPSPEVHSSFPSKLTFHWMNSLIYRGFKHILGPHDIWDLPPQCKGASVIPKFQHVFDEKQRRLTALRHRKEAKRAQAERKKTAEKIALSEKDFLLQKRTKVPGGPAPCVPGVPVRRPVPLLSSLVQTFCRQLLLANALRLVGDCVQFANPALLSTLIHYMENRDVYLQWHGYALVAGFFVVTLLVSVCQNQNFYHSNNTGMKIKTALVSTVYRKALSISNETRRQFTTGAIVNLMAIDCQKMQTVTAQLWNLTSAPLQISLAFYFLHRQLGVSFLVGVAIILALLPINARISIIARRYQASQLVLKDQRLKMMNEILSGIKVIKLSAWEEAFEKRASEIRKEEVSCLKKAAVLVTIQVFNWFCSPVLVTTGTLLTYTFTSEHHYLDPSTAFVSLSLFNILKNPLNHLPSCISELVQGHVSFRRLKDYLACEDFSQSDVGTAPEGLAVSIKGGTFTWDKDSPPLLSRVNLDIKVGQLVAVVGPVGSGKSSLLASFLGELRKLKGTVSLRGNVAYVPQQAWIQNRSLKDCVVFDNPFDERKYKKVIRACALRPDIESFPAGDATEIGEKGINLSGGQKLRVTLARAVYHDADIYLLDDPLSAVDSRVGKHIFRKVISSAGLLKGKTRVLVTHSVQWLPACDSIVVMDQGQIIQIGSYEDLLAHDGPFARYLKTYLRQDTEDLDPEVKQILGQMQVKLESVTEDGMTSADEDDYRCCRRSSRPKERATEMAEEFMIKRLLGKQLVQEEKSELGDVKGYVMKSLFRAFGVMPAVVSVILLVAFNGLGVAANIWLSRWTDDPYLRNISLAETSEYNRRTVVYVTAYSVLGALQAVATLFFVGTIYVNMITAAKHLHNQMLKAIMRQPMRFFDTNPVGRILNRFSRDIDAVDGSMARLVRLFLQQLFAVLCVLFVVSYSTPVFIAVAVPMVILYYLVQKFYIPCSRQLRRNESTSRSPIYAHFSETLSGATSIRAFGTTERFRSQNEKLVDNNNVYFYAFISASRWLRIRLELLGNCIVMFAALFAVLEDNLSGSLVGLSLSYALQITTALNMLVQNSTQLESNIVSVERIVEYASLAQEADNCVRQPAWVIPTNKPRNHWPEKGNIRFNKFSTRYRPGLDLVLHSISLFIQGGQKVGMVGRTGAGKSSLSLSLFRLIEAVEGSIIIDDINIADIGLHDLRSRLTILPQDPVLFSGTLRFNLDPLSEFSDDQVWSSLEMSHLKAFVDSLPLGLDHEVDEGGLNLSVGQRQLVCLARALLRKTRVLVLDEATAAVDMETDELIQRTIRSAFRECTVLTIAHRLHTVLDYDRILVLENGRIVELGSPESLLQDNKTIFYRMAYEAKLV